MNWFQRKWYALKIWWLARRILKHPSLKNDDLELLKFKLKRFDEGK